MSKNFLLFILLGGIIAVSSSLEIAMADSQPSLILVYPPNHHQTQAESIFLIGTASPGGEVLVNGEPIRRNQAGNFAPTFPLKIGENEFNIRYGNQEIQLQVTRLDTHPQIPPEGGFAKDSFSPSQDIARLPGELICFSAIASPTATVFVQLGKEKIPLFPQSQPVELPPNSALLNGNNQPLTSLSINYQGCSKFSQPGILGTPEFKLSIDNRQLTQTGSGKIEILSPSELKVIEVTGNPGVTRTGPSTDYSRLTPLPQGTQATVTGSQGDWLRLDYGAWINQSEAHFLPGNIPTQSLIRSINTRQVEGATEILFPLQVRVPVSINQGEKTLTLTLYNTTAQTDVIRLDDDPVIKRLDWQQVTPNQINYTFYLKSDQQWGYNLRYEGTTLILYLKHPPKINQSSPDSLKGISILLDPGHGGDELGAKGSNGYPEKEANLGIAKRLQQSLIKRGATVYLTRETDQDLSLKERVDKINKLNPTLSISLHYNALPDGGDPWKSQGIAAFWYHPQAHDLAIFLENYLVKKLNRPSYGVFWNNLALTRPNTVPSILLELGFMINPDEFQWIINPQEQDKLAQTLADGITAWFHQ